MSCWLVKSKSGSLRTIQYCLDEKFTRLSNMPLHPLRLQGHAANVVSQDHAKSFS